LLRLALSSSSIKSLKKKGIIRKGETLIRIEDSDFKVNVIRAKAGIAQAEQVLIREQAEGEIARRDYEELGRGTPSALALRQPQQAQAQASLLAAKAELETAELQLKRTYVRAPFDGRVRTKSSDLGQFAIAEVFDPYDKGASENGVPLPPGLFVDASIAGKSYENVIVLPRDGLRPEDEVYVVDDKGKIEVRNADVLDTNAENAFLLGGVAPGELVVLSPMEKSRISMTLKVLDATDPTVVLVDPPEPEWMKKAREAKKSGKNEKRGWGKKSKSDKDESNSTDEDKKDQEAKAKDTDKTDAGAESSGSDQ